MDQPNLKLLIDKWQNEDPLRKFKFRPYEEEGERLMYVHQEQWQRDLLARYGGDVCLMDATYKTTKYSLPMFFVCCKTNTGYSVVG